MSHHARALAAAVRGSLGSGPPLGGTAAEGSGAVGGSGGEDGPATHPSHQQQSQQQQQDCSEAPLEVLAKSSQDCWAAAWRPQGEGRQLLAVRERRSERELPEAADVMEALASQHFYM